MSSVLNSISLGDPVGVDSVSGSEDHKGYVDRPTTTWVVVRIADAHHRIGRIEGRKDVRRRGCRAAGNEQRCEDRETCDFIVNLKLAVCV
jgi:hypothetical protein